MPRLQIDGVDIAEIGSQLAGELLARARLGLGVEQQPASFQRAILFSLAKPTPPVLTTTINLDFPDVDQRSGLGPSYP